MSRPKQKKSVLDEDDNSVFFNRPALSQKSQRQQEQLQLPAANRKPSIVKTNDKVDQLIATSLGDDDVSQGDHKQSLRSLKLKLTSTGRKCDQNDTVLSRTSSNDNSESERQSTMNSYRKSTDSDRSGDINKTVGSTISTKSSRLQPSATPKWKQQSEQLRLAMSAGKKGTV